MNIFLFHLPIIRENLRKIKKDKFLHKFLNYSKNSILVNLLVVHLSL